MYKFLLLLIPFTVYPNVCVSQKDDDDIMIEEKSFSVVG